MKSISFANEYLLHLSGMRAYMEVYNAKSKNVAAGGRIEAVEKAGHIRIHRCKAKELSAKKEITQERVLQELVTIAYSKITDYVEVRAADAPGGKQAKVEVVTVRIYRRK